MPDVGVLNLQIHDDSSKAAEGLDRLASALIRVKQAVGGGLKLGPIANQIKKLNDAVAKAIPEQSLANLERFANAIEKLNAAGGIKLRGMKNMAESFNVEGTAEKIQGQIEGGMEAGFRTVQSRIQETKEQIDGMNSRMENFNQLVQQTAWSAGNMAEQFQKMFMIWNEMRMGSALGSGARPMLGDGSGSNSTGWQYYNPWGNVDETKWTEWKDGAIEAEYTISDAADQTFDAINNRIEGTKTLLLEAGETAGEYIEKMVGFKRVWNESTRSWENVGYAQSEFDDRIASMESVREAMMASQDNSAVNSAMERTGSIVDELKEKLKDAAWLIRDFGKKGAEGLPRLLSLVTNLTNQFSRIAKYRMLRAVLKQITEGIKEGTENYYRYSQAIGSSFAPAMDSAATSLQQMKNSIGASLAPVIQSLIPYLQIAVNWFINLINYANQFVSLLRGQPTWSRATNQSAKAFDDVKKSATGAAAAIKDLLADWDELNIIQSESNPTGGSGGGTKTMQDYLGMFEEVGTFENRIKAIVDILNKGFGDIWNLAKLIGIAILGWKVSQAFEGFLGALGTLVAGGALITIGIQLGYGAGFSAGEKGYFDGTDLLATAASAIAAGLGGWIITKSKTGIVIGVGVSLIATLVGYIEGQQDSADKLKWGENSLTPEEVEQYVRDQFSFDIEARITLLDSIIANQEEARSKLNEKITQFNETLNKVRIGVDGSPEGIAEAASAAGDVITQINTNLKNSEKNLEVLTKITPITSENGEEDLTDDFLSGIKIADTTLSEYFTGIGKEIAHWIDEGQKNEWKNNEAEMAMALMQHQQEILNQAESNKTRRNFQVDTELNLSSMTRDTAQAVLDKQTELVDQYKDKMKTAYENQVKELYYYADLADAAGLKDENGNALSEAYIASARVLLDKIKDGSIYDELEPDFQQMRQQWIEQLSKVYGKDAGGGIDFSFGTTNIFRDLFGKGTYFEEELRKALSSDGTNGAAKVVQERLEHILDGIDTTGVARKAASAFGFSIFDIMNQGDQKSLIDYIVDAVGDEGTATAILNAMGISDETISKAMGTTAKAGWEQVLDDMWSADWQNMADQQLLDYISTLRDKFGSDAVDQALSQLDIPAADLEVPLNTTVEESVETVTSEAGGNADTIWNNLGAYYENGTYQLPDADAHINITYGDDFDFDASDVVDEGGFVNLGVDLSDVEILGIPTEGGWLNNLGNLLFGEGPIEKDATVHVDFDVDEEDVDIWDLIGQQNTSLTGKKPWTTSQLTGHAGASSGVRYADNTSGAGGDTAVVVTMDSQQQQSNIQSGVQTGTIQLLQALQSLKDTADAINRKDFTVNITPTTMLGRMASMASGKFDTVTGRGNG